MEKYKSRSEAETAAVASKFASTLHRGDIVAMFGELGAGKTAFVKGVARFFNSRDSVSSPTFTVVNEYYGDITVYHFDAYRLENISLDQCDWMDDYFFGDGICIIEWAENIMPVLPKGFKTVKIEKNSAEGADYREITIC